jgi:uncharacterized protein YecT (DUF1311 family)
MRRGLPVATLAFGAALATAAQAQAPSCPGSTTPEVNACLGRTLAAAEAKHASYAAAVRRRLDREAKDVAPAFEKAEAAWRAYRDAECAAVFAFYAAGTIRTSEELACEIRLTRRQTHTLWREWMTYPDSTPPILPEPAVEPDR